MHKRNLNILLIFTTAKQRIHLDLQGYKWYYCLVIYVWAGVCPLPVLLILSQLAFGWVFRRVAVAFWSERRTDAQGAEAYLPVAE